MSIGRGKPAKPMPLEDLVALDKLLRDMDYPQAVKFKAKQFILDTHAIKWGKHCGQYLNKKSFREIKIIQIRHRSKALRMSKTRQFQIEGDKRFQQLQQFEGFEQAREDAFRLLRYGNFDYAHEFFPEVSTCKEMALVEILLQKPNIYQELFKVFQKGYYLCGHAAGNTVYVY